MEWTQLSTTLPNWTILRPATEEYTPGGREMAQSYQLDNKMCCVMFFMMSFWPLFSHFFLRYLQNLAIFEANKINKLHHSNTALDPTVDFDAISKFHLIKTFSIKIKQF